MKNKNTFVMCSKPSPDLTADMVTKAIDEIETEVDLATLFALVSNKAWWVEDNVPFPVKENKTYYKKMYE